MNDDENARVYDGLLAEPAGDDAEVRFTLSAPEARIRVADSAGRLGGATAEFQDGDHVRSWGAKHAWHEGEGAQRARVYEFDEPLPARGIRLRVRSQ